MILLNKHNLSAVLPAVSKEQSRYTLQGIQVTGQFTQATNGHMAIRVTLPSEGKPANFPKLPGFEANGFKSCILPVEAAKQVEKAIPKGGHIPILNHAAISTHEGQENTISVAVTDLVTHQVFTPKPVPGNFPNLQQVLDDVKPETAVFTVSLDAAYLEALAKSARQFGSRTVKIHCFDPMKAVRMEAKNEHGQQWTAIVMPVRER